MSWDDIPANLRTKYLRAGAITVARLVRLLNRLQVDPADLDALRALLRCFHALAGWGALDGLPIVGVAGQLGEHDCAALLSACVVPERQQLDQIKTLIYLLRREVRQQRRALALAGSPGTVPAVGVATVAICASGAPAALPSRPAFTGLPALPGTVETSGAVAIVEPVATATLPAAATLTLAALPAHDAVPAFPPTPAIPSTPAITAPAAFPDLVAPGASRAPASWPAAAEAVQAASGPAAEAPPAQRALLVGMEEDEAAVLGRFLALRGIASEAVETSFEAGRILGGGLPDAVIATAELADGTGYVLADYLRGLPGGQQPVVVILGAAGCSVDPGELVRCGIDVFSEGPVDGAVLSDCLAQRLARQAHNAPRVICLEGDPAEALALRDLLHAAGYRVRLCNDSRRLQRLALSFDAELLLMDVPLPDGTASDLVRRLRQDPRSAIVPIVLLTGADHPQSAAPSLIGTEYLAKPFAAADLLASVAHRIDRSRALRSLFAEAAPN